MFTCMTVWFMNVDSVTKLKQQSKKVSFVWSFSATSFSFRPTLHHKVLMNPKHDSSDLSLPAFGPEAQSTLSNRDVEQRTQRGAS